LIENDAVKIVILKIQDGEWPSFWKPLLITILPNKTERNIFKTKLASVFFLQKPPL